MRLIHRRDGHPVARVVLFVSLVTGSGAELYGRPIDIVAPVGIDEAWDPRNSPGNMSVTIDMPLSSMANRAQLPANVMPWSGDYWPTYRAGIAYRWQSRASGSSYLNYLYQPYSSQQAAGLYPQTIAALSPAEKYDLLVGRTDFPLTVGQLEKTRTSAVSGNVPSWYGICHGWAPASSMEPRPQRSVRVRGALGHDITFYPSDIKALISQVYSYQSVLGRFIGGRCNTRTVAFGPYGRPLDANCRDVNPGSFHLATVDYISRRRASYVMDIDPGYEVWHQPVGGYAYSVSNMRPFDQRDPLMSLRAPGTAYLADVTMELYYVTELGASYNSAQSRLAKKVFQYSLELDANQRVIGGEWLSKARPDFLWELTGRPTDFDNGLISYRKVRDLLAMSIAPGTQPGSEMPGSQTTPEVPVARPALNLSVFRVDPREGWHRMRVDVAGRVAAPGNYELWVTMIDMNGQSWMLRRQPVRNGAPYNISLLVDARAGVEIRTDLVGSGQLSYDRASIRLR